MYDQSSIERVHFFWRVATTSREFEDIIIRLQLGSIIPIYKTTNQGFGHLGWFSDNGGWLNATGETFVNNHGNLRYPPQSYPPQINKALLRDY